MRRKTVSGIMLILLLIGMLILTFNIQPVKASGTIYIRADGSIEGTPDIMTVDNFTYTFTDNIHDEIVVERDNIVVDGAGYTLQGTGSGTGIDITGRSNVTIKNMEIKAFRNGICLSGSSNNAISGNNIAENNDCGIWLGSSSNNTIYENKITNNDYGIFLDGSSNSSISGNNITANNWYGIVLSWASNDNSVSGNNIRNNEVGIVLHLFSNCNTISGNNITNNDYGIFLDGSSNDNSVSGNNIRNNGYGVCLESSSNNRIYHNNFINNTIQVSSNPAINFWDDGYPSGGNYWSDHACVGNPSDGSKPYVIDANNTDRYPFQDPNGWVIQGDMNSDGVVDIVDITIVALALWSEPGDPNWNPDADLNNDGIINIIDLVIVGVNFGKSLPL